VPLHAVPPSALVLTGIVSVQLGAGLATRLFSQAAPAAVTGLRLWSAAALLAVLGASGLASALRAMVRRRAWPDIAVVIMFGLTLGIMNYSIYQSFARIPLGIAVTIEFLGPLGVAVAASRRPVDLLWVALAGAGVALLSRGGTHQAGGAGGPHGAGLAVSGVGFALVAAAAWAGYILLSAATGRRFSGSSGLVIAMVVAALAVTPAAVSAAHGALARPGVLATGAAIGLLSSVIPYRFELEALRRIPAGVFGIWMSLEPAVAALVGLILLGQALRASEWAAVGCVMVACAGAARGPVARGPAARAAAKADSAAADSATAEPARQAAGPDAAPAIPPPPAS
jgi:inner membrane transporter RhtA